MEAIGKRHVIVFIWMLCRDRGAISFWMLGRDKGIRWEAECFFISYCADWSGMWERTAFHTENSAPRTVCILDLGCTRALGSRRGVEAFCRYVDSHPNSGLWYEIQPTSSRFFFASSQQSKCTEKLVIFMYDHGWNTQFKEFDIVEEFDVPLLMSLPQMKNLGFQFELTPEKTYLSCARIGMRKMVLKTAISTHLILDLKDVTWYMSQGHFKTPQVKSFFSQHDHFEYSQIAVKQDVHEEEALVTGDYWQVDPLRRELIRHHKDKRRNLHEMNPSEETPKDQLLDERDTHGVPEGQEEGSSQGQLAHRKEVFWTEWRVLEGQGHLQDQGGLRDPRWCCQKWPWSSKALSWKHPWSVSPWVSLFSAIRCTEKATLLTEGGRQTDFERTKLEKEWGRSFSSQGARR